MIDPAWTQFSFPTRWHYDVLRGLDYLRRAGVEPDQRVAEAIDLVERKRDSDGRWPLENPHAGKVHFDMEDGAGQPSRWNTLRGIAQCWTGIQRDMNAVATGTGMSTDRVSRSPNKTRADPQLTISRAMYGTRLKRMIRVL